MCSSDTALSSQGKQLDAAGPDNPQWQRYIASLNKNGYFNGNIPGSAQHKELIAIACQSFMQSQAQQPSASSNAAPAQSIFAILQEPTQPELFQVIHCRPCICTLSTGCAVAKYESTCLSQLLVAFALLHAWIAFRFVPSLPQQSRSNLQPCTFYYSSSFSGEGAADFGGVKRLGSCRLA